MKFVLRPALCQNAMPDSQTDTPLPAVVPLYLDESLVVIAKPPRLLVHRSEIATADRVFALQLVRDTFGQHVYPVHRLDRGTSGALIFAFSENAAKALAYQFAAGTVRKRYAVLVRGWMPEPVLCAHPLKPVKDPYLRSQKTEAQEALTLLSPWACTTVPVADGRYPQIRLTLAGAEPVTGRRHQIRRHLKHLSHPVIGDATYGKGPLNRALAPFLGTDRLMLHCARLTFAHPVTGAACDIVAPPETEFEAAISRLGLTEPYRKAVDAPWEAKPETASPSETDTMPRVLHQ